MFLYLKVAVSNAQDARSPPLLNRHIFESHFRSAQVDSRSLQGVRARTPVNRENLASRSKGLRSGPEHFRSPLRVLETANRILLTPGYSASPFRKLRRLNPRCRITGQRRRGSTRK